MFDRLKRLVGMAFQRTQYRVMQLLGTNVDYLKRVGDGTGSSTVMAPILWVARTFPEAPPMLWHKLPNRQREAIPDHKMLRLLERPNPFYTGISLWMATVIDYQVDGNAYWLKLRDEVGIPRELWWVPHWMMTPEGDSKNYVTRYKYSTGEHDFEVLPKDVVHFRFGLDPENMRLGRSPLKSVLREVYTDDEAAAFTAALLSNSGVPGVLVSPDKGVTISLEQAQEAKRDIQEKFTGDKRGEPIVMTAATNIEQFGFSPEQLILRELRRIPEERVTAVLGIPAIVAGLGAGLDRSTFTNMAEAREAAYEAGIIPMQRNLGEDIRFQLLGEFEADPFKFRFGFDTAEVRVLAEDLSRQGQRWALLMREGIATRAEARRGMNLDVDDQRDDVFIVPRNSMVVPADEPFTSEPDANGNGNGNGNGGLPTAVADELARRQALTV